MIKSGIDHDAMVQLFSQATAQQGETLRKTVSEATLKALQGREMTLRNIRAVIESMSQAASAGAARNANPAVDVESLLDKAIAGMDAALLQAVQANRTALQQFVDQGVGLQNGQMKSAVANLEKLEATFFGALSKAAQGADAAMQGPWAEALKATKLQGTDTGMQATQTVQQLLDQTQNQLREGRAMGMRTAQAMLENYSALVSGILIGMSEGMQQRPSGEAPARSSRKR